MNKVEKIKQIADDASSSGSEGYKNWKKHRFNFSKYIRINLKTENTSFASDTESLSSELIEGN